MRFNENVSTILPAAAPVLGNVRDEGRALIPALYPLEIASKTKSSTAVHANCHARTYGCCALLGCGLSSFEASVWAAVDRPPTAHVPQPSPPRPSSRPRCLPHPSTARPHSTRPPPARCLPAPHSPSGRRPPPDDASALPVASPVSSRRRAPVTRRLRAPPIADCGAYTR